MNWFEPVRAYCERNDAGFWAEPANALSNAAFLLAAAAAARRATQSRPPDRFGLGLAVLVAVIGIGSFLFHTLAVHWAMLADVIPIAVFIYAYLALALRRFLRLSRLRVVAATAGFALFGFSLTPMLDNMTGFDLSQLTNGSIDYLPALLALFGVTAMSLVRPEEHLIGTGRWLTGIGALFVISLAARTADQAACVVLPTETHPLWHVLNAAALYALVATAIRHRAIAG